MQETWGTGSRIVQNHDQCPKERNIAPSSGLFILSKQTKNLAPGHYKDSSGTRGGISAALTTFAQRHFRMEQHSDCGAAALRGRS